MILGNPTKRQFQFSIVFLVSMFCVGIGCNSQTHSKRQNDGTNTKSNRIVAVSYALQFLTQRIAGDKFKVEFPAEKATDPKDWSPEVEEIANIQKADLIVVNGSGAEYAKWLVRVTLPAAKICQTCESFELSDYITVKNYQIVHAHGPEGEHSHPYFVPYPWLDPAKAAKQSEVICDALKSIYPEYAKLFTINLKNLNQELEELSANIQPLKNNAVITANPFLKYLTQSFELEDNHLLWFDVSTIVDNDAEIDRLGKLLDDHSEAPLLTSQLLPNNVVDLVKRADRELVIIDPLDHKPETGDYLSQMRQNIRAINDLIKLYKP